MDDQVNMYHMLMNVYQKIDIIHGIYGNVNINEKAFRRK